MNLESSFACPFRALFAWNLRLRLLGHRAFSPGFSLPRAGSLVGPQRPQPRRPGEVRPVPPTPNLCFTFTCKLFHNDRSPSLSLSFNNYTAARHTTSARLQGRTTALGSLLLLLPQVKGFIARLQRVLGEYQAAHLAVIGLGRRSRSQK